MLSGIPFLVKATAGLGLGITSALSPFAAGHATTHHPHVAVHTVSAHKTAYHGKRRARRLVVHRKRRIDTSSTIVGDSAQVGRWTSEAMRLTGVHGSDWYSGLGIIARGESNDNQLVAPGQPGYFCDSNCAAGTPSEGIAQTIQATMDEYHQPGTSHNMLNPVADLCASINYIQVRYGSIDNVPGVASVRVGGHYEGY
jgi:hypothetical protein